MKLTVELGRKEMQHAMAEERQKTAEVTALRDDESRRCNSFERGKKKAELEVVRLKSQLLAATSAGAGG